MSEIRENKITGESVIIAPERAKRGGNLVSVG
jgi:galactose-1-phosphate uridylyltransferase